MLGESTPLPTPEQCPAVGIADSAYEGLLPLAAVIRTLEDETTDRFYELNSSLLDVYRKTRNIYGGDRCVYLRAANNCLECVAHKKAESTLGGVGSLTDLVSLQRSSNQS